LTRGYTTCDDRTRLVHLPPTPALIDSHSKRGHLGQSVGAAKVLLDTEVTRGLPAVVLEREEARLGTNLVHDLLHGSLLVLGASDGSAVAVTRFGPSDLGDVLALGSGLGADLGGLVELLSGEVAGHLGGDGGSEVGVNLDGEDIDVVAKSGTLLLPGTDGLSGGNGNIGGETAALELLADVVDVATELAGLAVVVEHALVSDNDHGNAVLGGLVLDVLKLGVGVAGEGALATGTATLKEDTVDDLQAILLALGNDVLEDTAVGAVGADGGEAHLGNLLDVSSDVHGGLALAIRSVWGVGDGPLVTVGGDVAARAVGASWLRLVGSLGAARLGSLSGLGLNRVLSRLAVDRDRLGDGWDLSGLGWSRRWDVGRVLSGLGGNRNRLGNSRDR
jgi:hypothetical protein